MDQLRSEPVPRVFIFSHPNHELAVHGIVRRLQPHLVYLSDGGGAERVADTCEGLRRIGYPARVSYLDYREQQLYDALLRRDTTLFEGIAARVAAVVDRVDPREVFCDAVEYYNPVHDMALPITLRALRHRPDVPLFEVPLVYQAPGPGEHYHLQRVPASRRSGALEQALTADESTSKRRAFNEGYAHLVAWLGPLADQDPTLYEREEVVRSPGGLPHRGADVELRYEWRGELLRDRSEVLDVITHDDHWLPMARHLVGHSVGVD